MKKNLLFLGFAVPDEELEKILCLDKFPAIQTHKFNWNLIKGMETCNDFNFTYISTRPISDYPYYPHKKIKANIWRVNLLGKDIEITEIPFINSSILKLFTRFFTGLFYSFKKYHKVKNKAGVIVYSVHVPFMMIGYVISRIYKIDYIAIWTDPPAISTSKDSGMKSKLRNIELKLSKYLMKKATKVIALTKYLAKDFAPGKPYMVMEGIIDLNDISFDIKEGRKEDNDIAKVVYTGSLEKRYGIKNIVEGFMLIEDENIVLEIYGRGDYEEELMKISSINNRIRYNGFVSPQNILSVQREADFLINARSAEYDYTKYSFPSKTLEYMLSGTPLITTILSGMPEEYRDYVIVLENSKPEIIRDTVIRASKQSKSQNYNIGLKALNFAKNKSYNIQGEKIAMFIKN